MTLGSNSTANVQRNAKEKREFKKAINAAFTASSMTAEELAGHFHTRPETVRRWLRGESMPGSYTYRENVLTTLRGWPK